MEVRTEGVQFILLQDDTNCNILNKRVQPDFDSFHMAREPVMEVINNIRPLQPRDAVRQRIFTMLSPRFPSPRCTRRQLAFHRCVVGRQHWLSMMNAVCHNLLLRARFFPALPRHVSPYAPFLTPYAFKMLPMIPEVFLVHIVTIAVEMVRSSMP